MGTDLPRVLGKAVQHVHVEVILALRPAAVLINVHGLNEGGVVIAGKWVRITGLPREGILHIALKIRVVVGSAVAVNAAALGTD